MIDEEADAIDWYMYLITSLMVRASGKPKSDIENEYALEIRGAAKAGLQRGRHIAGSEIRRHCESIPPVHGLTYVLSDQAISMAEGSF